MDRANKIEPVAGPHNSVPGQPVTTKQAALNSERQRWLEVASLPLLILLWQIVAMILQSRLAPTPISVAAHIWQLANTGPLIDDFIKTLSRSAVAFAVSMGLGIAIGLVLGRFRTADRLFSPWILVGLNMPAIIVAIICYIWLGLTEFALILAVVINKTPLVSTTVREGVRSFNPDYDELGHAFRMPYLRRMRIIYFPQLMPFILVAARTGLSLIWKIVLVFELLGSDGGVGFRIGLFFQFFDMKGILAYTLAFIAIVILTEYKLIRPLERKVAQ